MGSWIPGAMLLLLQLLQLLQLLNMVAVSEAGEELERNLSIAYQGVIKVGEVVHMDQDTQTQLIKLHLEQCFERMMTDPYPTNGTYCNRTWDGFMCWPEMPAGQVALLRCPNYINMFNISGLASRGCEADGHWTINPARNTSWTNYSACFPTLPTAAPDDDNIFREHLPKLNIVCNVGYGASLITLVAAVVLMLYFKKLHCPRNTLHVNLFVSFILRAAIYFLKDQLLVGGVGLSQDVYYDQTGQLRFKEHGSHWECKLLHTVSLVIISANCMWVFVEGLYLHMLIFKSVFSEKSSVGRYIAFGWCSPFVFVIPWIIVRALVADDKCWNLPVNSPYLWIIKAPITIAVAVNFLFFLNILRVLFTKLKASNTPEARKYRYRKLAKSTLVLIPLYGVHYIVFIWSQPDMGSDKMEMVWLYFENTFSSFQGFFIALLFCFLNGEVQAEIRKKWQRYQLRRGSLQSSSNRSNFFNTSTTLVPRLRSSLPGGERLESSVLSNGTSSRSDRSSSSPPKTVKVNGILKLGDNRSSSTRSDTTGENEVRQLIKEDVNSNAAPRRDTSAEDEGKSLMATEMHDMSRDKS